MQKWLPAAALECQYFDTPVIMEDYTIASLTKTSKEGIHWLGRDRMWRVTIFLVCCYFVDGRRYCVLSGSLPRLVRSVPECAVLCEFLSPCRDFTFCKNKEIMYCVTYTKFQHNACANQSSMMQSVNFSKVK